MTTELKRLPEYHIWLRIKQVCTNPSNRDWKHYGARGITMCDAWQASFGNFYHDMGPRPGPNGDRAHHAKYWIERIDNDGPYAPENCKWATVSEQQNNRSAFNRRLTYNDETLTFAEWERRVGLPPELIKQRVKLGWATERILTTSPDYRCHPSQRGATA